MSEEYKKYLEVHLGAVVRLSSEPFELSEYFKPIYKYQENIVSYMIETCPILTQSVENFKTEKGYISEDNLLSLYDEEKEKCGTKY